MRPASIIYFERLSVLSILVGIAFTMLTWDAEVKVAQASNLGSAFVPLVQGISLFIILLLIFLISRKASNIAKWILVALFVLGVAFIAPSLLQTLDQGLIGLLQLSQLIVQAAAIYFLFTPEARAWFGARGRPAT
jgi:prepilin signal peptidase PulO-like enzyme (type II secretory pathway)